MTEFEAGITGGSNPWSVTAGPDGNLWFTQAGTGGVGRITPQGVVTEFTAGITAESTPWDITSGPDGNLWFTDRFENQIGRITPQGVVTELTAALGPVRFEGITAGPDGNLWAAESQPLAVARITPQGVVSEFPSYPLIGAVRRRGAGAIALQARCPSAAAGPCRGRIEIWASAERPAFAAPRRRSGARRFSLAPGQTSELVVPLWRAARRALKGRRSFPLTVEVIPRGPESRRVTERVVTRSGFAIHRAP